MSYPTLPLRKANAMLHEWTKTAPIHRVILDADDRFVKSLCGSKPSSVHNIWIVSSDVDCKKCLKILRKTEHRH